MALYRQMVVDNIRKYKNGVIEFPIKALQEYHEAVGMGPEDLCYVGLALPSAESGLFNYVLGRTIDEDASVSIMDMYYFDEGTGEREALSRNRVLEGAIYRKFYNNEASFCGVMEFDNLGRLWVYAMTENNIRAEFCVQFSEGSLGYQFCCSDSSFCANVWFDGEKAFCSPVSIFFYKDPPC